MEAAHVDPDEDAPDGVRQRRQDERDLALQRARSGARAETVAEQDDDAAKPRISPSSRLSVIASSDSASEAMTIVNSGVVWPGGWPPDDESM